MVLIVIFIAILVFFGFIFGIPSALGLLLSMIGFAMLTSAPVLGIPLIIIGVVLFFILRRRA